jgi:CheY-like chemotaxis protein
MQEKIKSPKFIVVADDDPIVGEVISDTLLSAGYKIAVFEDPLKLIEALPTFSQTPDLLVADYRMPNLNGLELIERCKAQLPNLKAISLSGTLPLNEVQKFTRKPDKILSKPFLPNELLQLVKSLLRKD